MSNDQPYQGQSPEYLEGYSLACAPFENRIDPRFFYGGSALMQRLDLLTHLTQFGESVVVVTGPHGSGKTTLLSRFIRQVNRQWRLCLMNAEELPQLHHRLSDALRISGTDSEQELLTQWAAQTDASQLLVIVIDNAEQLDQDACNQLCQLLSLPQGERIRLLLFGTADTQQRVKHALEIQSSPRSTQMLEVPRLSEEETASYLMYRLAVAGYSGESPFAATEVRAICKAADGRPGAINQLAHQALLEHHARLRSKRPRRRPIQGAGKAWFWATATLAVALVAVYLGWQRYSTSPDSEQTPALAQIPKQPEIPLPLPQAGPTAMAPLTRPQEAAASKESRRAGGTEDKVAATAPEPLQQAAIPDLPPATESAMAQAESEPLPAAIAADLAAGETGEVQPEQAEPMAAAALSADSETPAPRQPAQAVTEAGTAETVATSTGQPSEAAPPDEQQPPASEAPSPPAPRDPSAPHREDWLLQQDANAYSLQLLGSRSEASITKFIRQHKLDVSQTAYYRGMYKGAEWYVLLYGSYSSSEAALAGRDELPAAVRNNKPWPRMLKSVHAAIAEVR